MLQSFLKTLSGWIHLASFDVEWGPKLRVSICFYRCPHPPSPHISVVSMISRRHHLPYAWNGQTIRQIEQLKPIRSALVFWSSSIDLKKKNNRINYLGIGQTWLLYHDQPHWHGTTRYNSIWWIISGYQWPGPAHFLTKPDKRGLFLDNFFINASICSPPNMSKDHMMNPYE